MSVSITERALARPPSPWTGSRHEVRHRWQLELAGDLDDATRTLRELAVELTAADSAGWWLVEPMSSGHLLAARRSRRQRTQPARPPHHDDGASPPLPPWRLRVVDETQVPGQEVFDAATAPRTPLLAWSGRSLDQVSGPALASDVLADTIRQVVPTGLRQRVWGVASARIGPNFDLVADGSALRMHTVHEGALIRTQEALDFHHAADGASTLLRAAAAYERLARAAGAMAAAGGRLTGADDGLLVVAYDPSVR